MAMLPKVLLSDFYVGMKGNLGPGGHHRWEDMPLGEINPPHAVVDGFVSFNLYHQIKIIERGRAHLIPIAPPPPPAPQPIATYCPSCLEKKEEEERARDANRGKRCMPPPGNKDDGAPSVLAGGWDDVRTWKKKKLHDGAGGWGDFRSSKKKIKQDDNGAGGSGSHVYPWNVPATKDRRW